MADMDRREEKEWRARVQAKPRLRSYKLIKVKPELEYLEVIAGRRKQPWWRSERCKRPRLRGRRKRIELRKESVLSVRAG